MGPNLVVVRGVRSEDPTQVRLAEHHHVVEAFASDRADEPLGMSVLPGRSARALSCSVLRRKCLH
jgi:hypothetical protein